ncbi:hypothetical protein CVD28_02140 [Bacillus sp. M6-12]|uniref:hypothetical protein n=1 Tax=Bacillus sp. M6-12 TaxID=2054166 RepID=UPI000C792A08|nr:hypothetical protein [Bacillus sp. M6-12]PLS19232.1 hypothetical protein CVD28_02140 [Bacillus sp. M6-12]
MMYLQIDPCKNQNKGEVKVTGLWFKMALSLFYKMGIIGACLFILKVTLKKLTDTGEIKSAQKVALLSVNFLVKGFLFLIFVSIWDCFSQIWWVCNLIIQAGDTDSLVSFLLGITKVINHFALELYLTTTLVALTVMSSKHKKGEKLSYFKVFWTCRHVFKIS